MTKIAKYINAEHTAILWNDNGKEMTVPVDPSNRHYGMIMTWLGESESNQIEEYVEPAKKPRIKGTAREFMGIFTKEEKLAIVNLSMSNAEVKLWYDEALAGDVELDHPDVQEGLLVMQIAGVITAERVAEILATDFDA